MRLKSVRIPASVLSLTIALVGCSDDADPSASTDETAAGSDGSTSDGSTSDGSTSNGSTSDGEATNTPTATAAPETGGSGTDESGAEMIEPVSVLNGSFEVPGLEPGCYHNLTNDEVDDTIPDVFGLGDANQVDLYADCFVDTADGVFHVGLGANGDDGDALALALSGPLEGPYRVRFLAEYGQTGAAVSTDVSVGLSSEVGFGVEVGRTGPLTDARTEYTFDIVGQGETFITLAVVPDGDLGWAMIDAVELEAL